MYATYLSRLSMTGQISSAGIAPAGSAVCTLRPKDDVVCRRKGCCLAWGRDATYKLQLERIKKASPTHTTIRSEERRRRQCLDQPFGTRYSAQASVAFPSPIDLLVSKGLLTNSCNRFYCQISITLTPSSLGSWTPTYASYVRVC